MPVDKDPDIWALIFEQTPQALRWVLGVATLGVFTLLSILYRWHRAARSSSAAMSNFAFSRVTAMPSWSSSISFAPSSRPAAM